jgi:G6PDH family F420-dependent oxidoreductase
MTSFGFTLSSEELDAPTLVDTARQAESAGFERIWVSDHYHPWNTAQGQSPFVWSVLGAIAATTELRLTTAVTCPTFRIHPAVLAQATATVASMAADRFRFGVGSGEALNEHILGDAWPPVSIRLGRLEEAIAVIRRLWAGDTVTHEGRYFTVHNARIFSLPPRPPPILVSGFGPESTALAARVADGWISTSPDAEGLREYRRAGGTGATQAGLKICYAASEQAGAETAARLWGHQVVSGQSSQDLPTWHAFAGLAEQATPEDIARIVPCGPDAQRAADSVQQFVDAGFDEVYIAQMGPDQQGALRFLTNEVLPLVV